MLRPMTEVPGERRPLTTRDQAWARSLAAALARAGVSPNGISLGSVAAAALGMGAFLALPEVAESRTRAGLYVAAAAMIQLRLLCNMLDGMVAVEGGLRSRTGELFNEVPDRLADLLLLAGAGYAARELPHGLELGWLAAALAIFTAYVRAFGKSVGAGMHFVGPMAKPHRMATLTAACLVAAALSATPHHGRALLAALVLISAGCVWTIVRRLRRIAAALPAP